MSGSRQVGQIEIYVAAPDVSVLDPDPSRFKLCSRRLRVQMASRVSIQRGIGGGSTIDVVSSALCEGCYSRIFN